MYWILTYILILFILATVIFFLRFLRMMRNSYQLQKIEEEKFRKLIANIQQREEWNDQRFFSFLREIGHERGHNDLLQLIKERKVHWLRTIGTLGGGTERIEYQSENIKGFSMNIVAGKNPAGQYIYYSVDFNDDKKRFWNVRYFYNPGVTTSTAFGSQIAQLYFETVESAYNPRS